MANDVVRMIILTNKIRCKNCGEILESKSVHDFKMCGCGACGVDGGRSYLRRIGESEAWEELSEYKIEYSLSTARTIPEGGR